MLTTEDRLDILELLARYNYAIDDSDGAAWADCFVADGAFESPTHSLHGRDELQAFAADSPLGALHLTTNQIIEGDGDRARMRCYLELVSAAAGAQPEIRFCGRYEDELVKTAAGWRFSKRTVGPVW